MEEQKSLVLVVDDIRTNVEFIRDILITLDNVSVLAASNGIEALEVVREHTPDLILLDVAMPEMDGFEVCKRLQADKKFHEIPVIFLTARVQKEDIVYGFEIGAVDYITKPFNITELLSRVKTHLDLRLKTNELKEINNVLELKVEERTQQLSKANEKLRESNEQLSQALDELAGLDNAKNEFIAHINHELRTPLNGIMGYTTLLDDVLQDEESKQYLNSINMLVSRLTNVAEITLLLTELKTVNNKVNTKVLELDSLINRVLERQDMQTKNLEVVMHSIPNPKPVKAEPRLLSTCLSIILDNAVKYSPAEGTIDIFIRDNERYMTTEIIDQGPGFTENVKSQLFELFTADNLEHRSHGFGIGLATAKMIIDLLGGKISINQRDSGASVSLQLKKAN